MSRQTRAEREQTSEDAARAFSAWFSESFHADDAARRGCVSCNCRIETRCRWPRRRPSCCFSTCTRRCITNPRCFVRKCSPRRKSRRSSTTISSRGVEAFETATRTRRRRGEPVGVPVRGPPRFRVSRRRREFSHVVRGFHRHRWSHRCLRGSARGADERLERRARATRRGGCESPPSRGTRRGVRRIARARRGESERGGRTAP